MLVIESAFIFTADLKQNELIGEMVGDGVSLGIAVKLEVEKEPSKSQFFNLWLLVQRFSM